MADQDSSDGIPDFVTNPRLRALVRYWAEKRGDRRMPSRHDIDPVEIPRLLPIVLMADAMNDPPRIRLLGTEATSALGREMRGHPVDAFAFNGFTAAWLKAFGAVASSGAPTTALGSHGDSRHHWMVEVVLLPLSEDETQVQHIFGGLHIKPIKAGCEPPRQSVVQVLPLIRRAPYQRGCSSG